MIKIDKQILYDYMDACALVTETETDIRRLHKKRKTIIQTNVKGSNPEFPYNEQHFKIQGTPFSYVDDGQLRMEESLLIERKANAEKIKLDVERWMVKASTRMQRIIRLKVFQRKNWEEVATQLGRGATAESVRKEFERFMEEF